MATTLSYLDSYCERAGHLELFAEPLNFITNIFFIAAALAAFYLIVRLPPQPLRKKLDLHLLATALFAIGLGSGLWHFVPNSTTVLLDVIPITLFIHLYLISAMRRILLFSWIRTLFWWAVYVGVTIVAQLKLPPDLLNGTVMYMPTYLALFILTGAVWARSHHFGQVFCAVFIIWSASLMFRTYDQEWCKIMTMGTHFMWHTLNAWVLYRLLVTVIRYRPPVTIILPE